MSKAYKRRKIGESEEKEKFTEEIKLIGYKKNEKGESDRKYQNNIEKESENTDEEFKKKIENENKEMKKKIKEMEKKIEMLEEENKDIKAENDKLKFLLKENKIESIPKIPSPNQNKVKDKINKNNNNFIDYNDKNNKIPENNLIVKEQVFQNIPSYNKPTLVGLQNIGATCFMNSTLQCLSQTKGLTNYFLKDSNLERIIKNNIAKENPKEYQLSPVYHELIQNLWKVGGPKYYAPYNFMNRVNDMNPLFKKGEAGDAKDFIIFVLEQMHKELNKPLKIKKIKDVPTINQYDKNNTFKNFFNEFIENTSILSDLFFGFNETTNICLNCKNKCGGVNYPICYNYNIFNLIIFPLEEVKNMKNSNNMANIFNFYPGPSNVVNIDDCFRYNEKTDLFNGENKNYCNICKQLSDSLYTSKIYVSPNILILILNRGKGNKYNIKMDFQQTIDITNYVIQKDKAKICYNLYGVITHHGKSGPNAHFIASCKSPVDGNWYRYNDAIVEPIKDFFQDIYNFGNPYILFYEKI